MKKKIPYNGLSIRHCKIKKIIELIQRYSHRNYLNRSTEKRLEKKRY